MHHHGDRTAWLNGGDARCEDPGPVPRRPWHIVLLGPPGVGKGTQAELIVNALGACHLSTGDVFRAAHSATACGGVVSPAMTEAIAAMQRGELVSDATVVNLVRERVQCLCCNHGFLLDGFPRTVEQAEALDAMLAGVHARLDAVVDFTAPEHAIVDRLSGRRVCRQCKMNYHVQNRPPRRDGVCDKCGGAIVQREDDRPESIHTRIAAYTATAGAVVEFYRRRGLLHEIDASGAPLQIFRRVHQLLLAV